MLKEGIITWASLLAMVLSYDLNGMIITQPISQSVPLNSTVTIPCRVRVPMDGTKIDVFWSKDNFGIGGTREDVQNYGFSSTYNYPRYDLPNNLEIGHYDLQIRNINIYDDGNYMCQVNYRDTMIHSQSAKLTVLVPSLTPMMYQYVNKTGVYLGERNKTHPVVVYDGETVLLECLTKNGMPGADIAWYLDDLAIDKNSFSSVKITTKKTTSQLFKRFYDTSSRIVFKINKMRHGSVVSCRANNQGYENYEQPSKDANIQVNYGPELTISANHPNYTYIEQDHVRFECSATGRPSNFTWKWMVNNKLVANAKEPYYQFVMTKAYHNADISCIATSFRENKISHKVYAKFGPEFVEDAAFLYPSAIGNDERMTCEARGNPEPRIEWHRENSRDVFSREKYLLIKGVTREDFGVYICTAKVDGFKPISKRFYLLPKQPPRILPTKIFRGSLGQQVVLKCEAMAVPPLITDRTSWSLNGRLVNRDALHFFEEEISTDGTVFVKLIIRKLRVNDFGEYNCSVWNSLGTDTKSVKLIIEDSIPLNFIISLCVVAIISLSLVLLFYFVFKHRKTRREYEKSNMASISKNFDKNPFTSTLLGSAKSKMAPAILTESNGYPAQYSEWNLIPDKTQSHYIDPFRNYCTSEYDDRTSIGHNQKYHLSSHDLSSTNNNNNRNELSCPDHIYRITTPNMIACQEINGHNISYTGSIFNACSPNMDRRSFIQQPIYGTGYLTNNSNKEFIPYHETLNHHGSHAYIVGSPVPMANGTSTIARKNYLSDDLNQIGEHATNV